MDALLANAAHRVSTIVDALEDKDGLVLLASLQWIGHYPALRETIRRSIPRFSEGWIESGVKSGLRHPCSAHPTSE